MEHQSAIDLQFAERYLLDELSPQEAAEFEAHFFECALCAEEVREGSRLHANLKAVLEDSVHEGKIGRDGQAAVDLRPPDRFLDLTISLEPYEAAPTIECEFHFAAVPSPLVMAALATNGAIQLRLPAERLASGACTVVLRDKDSRRELGQRQLLIAKPE